MDNTQNYKDLFDAAALMLGKMVAENALLRVRLNSPKADAGQSLDLALEQLQRLKAENTELKKAVEALRAEIDLRGKLADIPMYPDRDQSLNQELQRLKAENAELNEVVRVLRSRLDQMPKEGGLLGEAYAKIGELEAQIKEAEALIPWIREDNYVDRPGKPKPSVAEYIDRIAGYKAKYPDAKIVDRR